MLKNPVPRGSRALTPPVYSSEPWGLMLFASNGALEEIVHAVPVRTRRRLVHLG